MKDISIIENLALMAFLLFSNVAMSQNDPGSTENRIASIRQLYQIVDTVDSNHNSVTLNILWMDSIIGIRKTTSLKYNLEYARKYRRDSTFIPTPEDTLNHYNLRLTGSQNCHSYSLEKFFEYHNITGNELFTNRTVVTENKFIDNILAASFKKVATIPTKPKKNLKHNFTKGSILVFRNKWNSPIHTVFYDGRFHSKYGAWSAKTEEKLKTVFDRYWDTMIIEAFVFDEEKVVNYLTPGNDL